jgi:hypothetical protein
MNEAPVLITTGFFFFAITSSNGRLFISAEAILKNLRKGFKKFTASSSKGVDANSIFFFYSKDTKFYNDEN